MALQTFRADQHPFEVTAVTVDQVTWFKGNEVAACLGYVRPRNAVKDHVDEEDKKTYGQLMEGVVSPTPPSNQTMMRWYSSMTRQALRRKKQATMHKYLKYRACSSSSSSSAAEETAQADP